MSPLPETANADGNGHVPMNGIVEHPSVSALPEEPATDEKLGLTTGNSTEPHRLEGSEAEGDSSSPHYQGKKRVKLRMLKTTCLYMAFLAVGFATNILGPTLTNMRVFLNTNTESIVSAFSGSILGWIGGSVVAAVVYERFNSELQLTLSCLTMCLATGLAPWTDNLVAFVALMTVQGLGAGFVDAAGQPYGLRLWNGSKRKDPVMQATQLFMSIGSAVAPLIANPFLIEVDDEEDGNSTSAEVGDTATVTTDDGGVAVVHPLVSNTTSYGYLSGSLADSLAENATNASGAPAEVIDSGGMLVGFAYVSFSVIILVVTVLFFITYLLNGPSCRVKKSSKAQSKDEYHPSKLTFRIAIYGLLFLYFFMLMWISGLGHLIPTLVTDGLGWKVEHGSLIATVFWGMLGVGRMVGIPLSTRLSPAKMLVIDTGLAVVALALMSLVSVAGDVIMWFSAGLAGLATASEFASGVLWASKYVEFSGAVAAVCITGMGIGGIAGVQVAGYLFDMGQYLTAIYVSLAATVAHFVLFVFMHLSVEAWYKRIKEADGEAQQRQSPREVELTPLKRAAEVSEA